MRPRSVALIVPALAVGLVLGGWAGGVLFARAPSSTSDGVIAVNSPSVAGERSTTPNVSATPSAPASKVPASKVPALTAPAAPTDVTLTVRHEGGAGLEILVQWRPGADNGSPITGHGVVVRSDRGSQASRQTGASDAGGVVEIQCGAQVCDGMRVEAQVRAISSAGPGAAGSGATTYSAPFRVNRELRSDQGAANPTAAYQNAQGRLPGLRSSILSSGVGCTNWNERVISVYTTPDGTWYIYAGIVSAFCKY